MGQIVPKCDALWRSASQLNLDHNLIICVCPAKDTHTDTHKDTHTAADADAGGFGGWCPLNVIIVRNIQWILKRNANPQNKSHTLTSQCRRKVITLLLDHISCHHTHCMLLFAGTYGETRPKGSGVLFRFTCGGWTVERMNGWRLRGWGGRCNSQSGTSCTANQRMYESKNRLCGNWGGKSSAVLN